MSTRAVVFDRDGTLIADGAERVAETPSDIPLLPGVRAACEILRAAGYRLFIATNQACIGRGDSPAERQLAICEDLARRLGIETWRICPHPPELGCKCRKPKPGLLLSLIGEFGLDAGRSWFVGDAETDVQAGQAAGTRTARLTTESVLTGADYSFADLLGFALFAVREPRGGDLPGARGF